MKNPILQKKYDEGFKAGLRHGVEASERTINRLIHDLQKINGIGPKTFQKIIKGLKLDE